MARNEPTGFNACVKELLDICKESEGLTQQAVADEIGVTMLALNRTANAEKMLGHDPLAKLLDLARASDEMAKKTWAEWGLDIFTRSKMGKAYDPPAIRPGDDETDSRDQAKRHQSRPKSPSTKRLMTGARSHFRTLSRLWDFLSHSQDFL